MATSPKTERPKDERPEPNPDPRWDRKQGTPKDSRMANTVERSSSRYSASEQSEEKRKDNKR